MVFPSRKRYIMTIADLIAAKVELSGIGEWLTGIYETTTTQGAVAGIWDMLKAYLELIPAATALAFLAFAFIEVFAGKKILPLQKFLGSFFVGFIAGAYFIYPMVAAILPVTDLMVGLVVGVVAALVCRLVYFLAFVLCIGYPVYFLCMTGAIAPLAAMTAENMTMSGAVALGVVFVALLFRKWVEMLGTAVFGGLLVFLALDDLLIALIGGGFDLLVFTAPYVEIIKPAIIAIFGFFGFVYQAKHRRRF